MSEVSSILVSSDVSAIIMKGTKVLTLGEGRGISNTHAIHVYACAVLLLAFHIMNNTAYVRIYVRMKIEIKQK